MTLLSVIVAPSASALSKTLEAHMPEIVQWVYRNGAVETVHPCEVTCTELWDAEQTEPPGTKALEQLHHLESGLPLWGTATELKDAIDAGTRYLGTSPVRVGWWIVDGGAPGAAKWVELMGPASPSCGPKPKARLVDPGEEVGGTFYEHVYAPGEDWYLQCSEELGDVDWQQIRTPTNEKPCDTTTGAPSYRGFIRQEWLRNICWEGGEDFSNVFTSTYYSPLVVTRVEDWTGQHLEGEATFNIETYGGADPGITRAAEATEAALASGGSWLAEYLEWALAGKHGRRPSPTTPEEAFGAGHPATPDQTQCLEGHPVDCATGNQTETQIDLLVGGRGPSLSLTRSYNSQAAAKAWSGPFGYGWTSSFSAHLEVDPETGVATVYNGDGSVVRYAKSGSDWVAVNPLVEALLTSEGGGYLYTLPDQTTLHFNSAGELTSEGDRNGNTLTMERSESGQLESVADAAGRRLIFTYNGEGLVESVKDPMGRTVKYAYESGQLASVTEPGEASPRWRFKYNASHELTSETDGRGHSVTSEYDGQHRVIAQKDAMGRKRTWNYEGSGSAPQTTITEPNGSHTVEHFDEAGEPTSVTRAEGTALASTTSYGYDEAGHLEARTDADGHTTVYAYDAAGNRVGETDALGHTTTSTYDAKHDLETRTTPNGETTTIERDAHGNAVAVSRPAPGGASQVTKYKYAANGDVESMTDPLGRTSEYEYDSYGDRTGQIDAEGDKRTFVYDEDSELTSIVSPRGHLAGAEESEFTTSIARDARGRPLTVTDPEKHETKYTYDANGNVESETDPEGHTTTYSYNADNELTEVKQPSGATSEAEYDSEGQVVAQIDGDKHATKYVRDALGEVTEVIDPLERKTLKEYDAAGNLTKLTDAAKRSTTYSYDAVNRLVEVCYSDGKTATVKYEYDPDGDRTKMVDGTGTTAYAYDALDRLIETKDGHGTVVDYKYDLANEQTKIVYPGGGVITRTFDKAGRLESTSDWLGHTTKFGYDADSNQTSTTYPAGSGDVDTYSYDPDGEMEAVAMKNGSSPLASVEYTRDKDGQVTKATTKGLPGAEASAFAYDEDGRLTKGAGTEYGYDAADNRTSAGAATYGYDAADELDESTGTAYEYDQLGERTDASGLATGAFSYGYDQAGDLTSVIRPKSGELSGIEDSYGYDGDGLRASETVSGTTTYLTWDLAEPLPSLLSNEVKSYVYGPNDLPVEQITGEGVFYLHHDQQGSTRLLTNSAGAAVGAMTYDAYGDTLGSTGSITTPFGYDGQYTNTDTGLIYLRAREYDPSTAQFLSSDPLTDLTWEPYSYAFDDPLNNLDPTGLEAVPLPFEGPEVSACLTPETIGPCVVVGSGGYIIAEGVKSIVNAWAGEEPGNDEGEAILKQREAEEAEQANEDCGQEPPRSLPYQGGPNSTTVLDRGNGTGQIRDYGPDGLPLRDFDFGHDHGFGDPHAHDWVEGVRGPGRPIGPNEQ